MKAYPKVSELITRAKNSKYYSFLPLDVILSVFGVSLVSFAAITLCIASHWVLTVVYVICNLSDSND
jgi:hypothetical protein